MQDDPNDPGDGSGSQAGGAGSGAPTFDQVNADYQKYLGRPLSQAEFDANYAHATRYDGSMIANSPEGLAYTNSQLGIPPGGTTPPPATGPAGSGGARGPAAPPDIMNGPLTKPFPGVFTKPTPTAMPGLPTTQPAPTFNGPAFPTIPKFTAPSAAEALNDPGYQFRLQQGAAQLQNWAAAKGTLNDSGTANAMQDYGQNSASQEYQNVWNRDYSAYNTNTQNQYLAPWAAAYQNATVGNQNAMTGYQTANQNAMTGYTTSSAATQHTNDTNYLNAWNEFINKQNDYNNWQDRVYGKLHTSATS